MASLIEQFRATFPTSERLAKEAKHYFPDGVTHDLRNLSPFPLYIDRAESSKKIEVDGKEFIDFWTGHGSLLMGHSHASIVKAVQEQITRGTHPGACHELEIRWAKLIQDLMPSAEKIRFVASGTEATLMALRLVRMHTGKPRILKFAGHFHGWHDALMIAVDHLENQHLPGAPKEITQQTVVIPPNDANLLEDTLLKDEFIGCVILEPTGGHWGQVPIREKFLQELREITSRLNRVLIFDEVITGFRVSPGGAQGHYGVTPDLTTLAKIVAGGLPGGCCVGRADILDHLETRANREKMSHPGTFNANPLSAAAGIAVLEQVKTGEPTMRANQIAIELRRQLNEMFRDEGIPWLAYGEFAAFRLIANYDGPPWNGEADFLPYEGDFLKLNQYPPRELSHAFRCAMLLNGVDPIGLSGLTMAVHTDEDIRHTVEAVKRSISMLPVGSGSDG